jgi:hypothetical protein
VRGRALTHCGEHLIRITSEDCSSRLGRGSPGAPGHPLCAEWCRSCRGAIGLCCALAPRRLPSAGSILSCAFCRPLPSRRGTRGQERAARTCGWLVDQMSPIISGPCRQLTSPPTSLPLLPRNPPRRQRRQISSRPADRSAARGAGKVRGGVDAKYQLESGPEAIPGPTGPAASQSRQAGAAITGAYFKNRR